MMQALLLYVQQTCQTDSARASNCPDFPFLPGSKTRVDRADNHWVMGRHTAGVQDMQMTRELQKILWQEVSD
jgi:hypothetical protein